MNKPLLPRLVKFFSFLFWIPFAFLAVVWVYLVYQASHGVSGTEYIAIVLAPVFLVVAVAGCIYIVLLFFYVFSKHPTRTKRFLAVIALAILVALYSWQAVVAVKDISRHNESKRILADSEVIDLIETCQVQSLSKDGGVVHLNLVDGAYTNFKGEWLWRSTTANSANWDEFLARLKEVKDRCGGDLEAFDYAGPVVSWISVKHATELLKKCQVKTFNYTGSSLADEKPSSGKPTGIVLVQHPTFSHLYIDSDMEKTMIPIARSVQKKCDGPQFYHDGRYEQEQPDGSWQ